VSLNKLYFNAITNLKEKLVKMEKNVDAMPNFIKLPSYSTGNDSWNFISFYSFFSVNIFYSVNSED